MDKTEPAGLDIRYTYITDITYLKSWLMQPAVLKWFAMTTEKEVDDAAQCWMGFCRYSASLTATIDNTPCGIGTLFLMPYKKVAHHALMKIVVDPAYQRQGIGTALVRNLKHLAKEYFPLDLLHTEVFEGNPLISLLEHQGFSLYAQQEKYVKTETGYLGRLLYEINLREKE